MKTWMKMMIAVAVMALMAACHPDDKNGKKSGTTQEGTEGSVYLSLDIALPPAGPAAKDDGEVGVEPGTSEENAVSSLLIVLADHDDHSYISHGTVANPTRSSSTGNMTGVSNIGRDGIMQYYAAHVDGTKPEDEQVLENNKNLIDVFVFCNYTQELLEAVQHSGQAGETEAGHASSQWIHAVGHVLAKVDESIWTNGYFLMSNQSIATREIPERLKDWNTYGDESNAFNLCGQNGASGSGINNGSADRGPITVQRVMARIDLKDGSLGGDWTYPITTTGSGDGILQVKIERVALVNQSKNFYFLKHMAKSDATTALDRANVANQEVCGAETGSGLSFAYVADADAGEDYKQKSTTEQQIAENATYDNYMYPLFNNSGAINDAVRQNWKATDMSGLTKDKYTPWMYTTENTTPHTSNRAGITTGIVFKGRLVPTDGVNETLKAAATGTYEIPSGHNPNEYYLTKVSSSDTRTWPLLYAFGEIGRKLFVGWNDQVKDEVEKVIGTDNPTPEQIASLPEGTIAYAYYTPCYIPEGETAEVSPNEMFQRLLAVQQSSASDRQTIERAQEAFKAAAVKAKFTVYQAGLAIDDFSGDLTGQDADDVGYFCYYFYWIRHNLTESVGDIYPMEYAVVRNNVYKLSIQTIRRFGHPRLSAHDVDPMTVNTPCEKSELYMSVEVKVADWVTRESEIIL